MEAYPPRAEVLQWTYMEVADQVAAFLGTGDYRQEFMAQQVDGELLLDLTRDDCRDLGIKRLRDLKNLLRWVARYTFPADPPARFEDKKLIASQPAPDTTPASKTKLEEEADYAGVVSHSGILSNLENSENPHEEVDDGAGGVDGIGDPLFCYNRIFKRRPPTVPFSDDNLYGKRYLKKFYPDAYATFNKNLVAVRSWFKDSRDPVITTFYKSNFRGDKEAQDAVKQFIREREPLLPSLRFACTGGSRRVVKLRWKVDDIYHWFLEYKHYANSKRVDTTSAHKVKRRHGKRYASPAGGSDSEPAADDDDESAAAAEDAADVAAAKRPRRALSRDDERWLKLCRSGEYALQLWGLKEPLSTHKLQQRERKFKRSKELQEHGAHFEGRAGVRLFGYGTPVAVAATAPYKVWKVKVQKAFAFAGDLYVPRGEEFEDCRRQVKSVREGEILEIPGTFVSIHPVVQLTETKMSAHHVVAESAKATEEAMRIQDQEKEEMDQLTADLATRAADPKISNIKQIFATSQDEDALSGLLLQINGLHRAGVIVGVGSRVHLAGTGTHNQAPGCAPDELGEKLCLLKFCTRTA